jgi:undecaprenyl pyrophosphate synthase
MDFSQIGGHNHCQLPGSQQPEVLAFIVRFLLLQSANTDIFFTDRPFPDPTAKWCPWFVPTFP